MIGQIVGLGDRLESARDLTEFMAVDDPTSRTCYRPGHFTASGLVVSGGSILLVFHERLGQWLQPGGHIEPEDGSLLGAAAREVAEETGITVGPHGELFDVDVHEIPAGHEPRHRHADVRFLFELESMPAVTRSGAKWVDMHDVAEITSDASIGRAVARLTEERSSA